MQEHGDGMQVVLRTVTRPMDIDASGHIPSGWLLARLDQAGAVVPSGHFARPAVLAELDALRVLARPALGERVSFLAKPLDVQDGQVRMLVEAWAEAAGHGAPRLLVRAAARFVLGEVCAPEHLFPGSFPA